MQIGIRKEQLIREFSAHVIDGVAAFFAGAGLSLPAGYVDWRELMREIAEDLSLEVDRETDLIALAQYHCNQRGSRSKLNQKLIDEFTKKSGPTVNHTLMASMPVDTYWTTNYDTLIENALASQGKRIDVKVSQESIASFLRGADAVVYKMHGDVSQPDKAVLTKDDYENYHGKRQLFTVKLSSDLVSRRFLFLGFSFSDPNIDYILSRIKVLLGENRPTHYCVMRRPTKPTSGSATEAADYEYDMRRLALRVDDLKRFGILTALVDDYSEITDILQSISAKAFTNNVFVSGSAIVGDDRFDLVRLQNFCRELGRELIRRRLNIISGYGLGVGPELLTGALEAIYSTQESIRERLILRPFPITVESSRRSEVFRNWRKSMLDVAGISIFLAGNKADPSQPGKVVNADGVMEEFLLGQASKFHLWPIPVGATGHMAKVIWKIVFDDLRKYYSEMDVVDEFRKLGDPACTDEELLNAIVGVIEKINLSKSAK